MWKVQPCSVSEIAAFPLTDMNPLEVPLCTELRAESASAWDLCARLAGAGADIDNPEYKALVEHFLVVVYFQLLREESRLSGEVVHQPKLKMEARLIATFSSVAAACALQSLLAKEGMQREQITQGITEMGTKRDVARAALGVSVEDAARNWCGLEPTESATLLLPGDVPVEDRRFQLELEETHPAYGTVLDGAARTLLTGKFFSHLPVLYHAREVQQYSKTCNIAVIQGATGSGKTTVLTYLILKAACEQICGQQWKQFDVAQRPRVILISQRWIAIKQATDTLKLMLQDVGFTESVASVYGRGHGSYSSGVRDVPVILGTPEAMSLAMAELQMFFPQHAVDSDRGGSAPPLLHILLDDVDVKDAALEGLAETFRYFCELGLMKMWILSANVEAVDFPAGSEFLQITARTFPILQVECEVDNRHKGDHVTTLVRTFGQVGASILFFFPGASEIDDAVTLVKKALCQDHWPGRNHGQQVNKVCVEVKQFPTSASACDIPVYQKPTFELIPVYGTGPKGNAAYVTQIRKHEGAPVVQIIFATDMLANGVTPQGTVAVVDSQTGKRPMTHGSCDFLAPMRITKAEANQRRGRTGRQCIGVCVKTTDATAYPSARQQAYTADTLAEAIFKFVVMVRSAGLTWQAICGRADSALFPAPMKDATGLQCVLFLVTQGLVVVYHKQAPSMDVLETVEAAYFRKQLEALDTTPNSSSNVAAEVGLSHLITKELVLSCYGELVRSIALPLVAARLAVLVACMCGPAHVWIAMRALVDLGMLPNDMETDAAERSTGIVAGLREDSYILQFLSGTETGLPYLRKLSPVVLEKISRFSRLFRTFMQKVGPVKIAALLGPELTALLTQRNRGYVQDEMLKSDINTENTRQLSSHVAVSIGMALHATVPRRNTAYALCSKPGHRLVLLGTGCVVMISDKGLKPATHGHLQGPIVVSAPKFEYWASHNRYNFFESDFLQILCGKSVATVHRNVQLWNNQQPKWKSCGLTIVLTDSAMSVRRVGGLDWQESMWPLIAQLYDLPPVLYIPCGGMSLDDIMVYQLWLQDMLPMLFGQEEVDYMTRVATQLSYIIVYSFTDVVEMPIDVYHEKVISTLAVLQRRCSSGATEGSNHVVLVVADPKLFKPSIPNGVQLKKAYKIVTAASMLLQLSLVDVSKVYEQYPHWRATDRLHTDAAGQDAVPFVAHLACRKMAQLMALSSPDSDHSPSHVCRGKEGCCAASHLELYLNKERSRREFDANTTVISH